MSSALIRQDLVPMVVGYALIMGALAIGLRLSWRLARAGTAAANTAAGGETGRATVRARLRAIAAPGPGWRRLVVHCLRTAAGGYLLLMAVIIGYYYGVAPVAGNFVHSAFSGCAMLVGLAAPVFLALSWLAERKGWRI